MTNLDTETVAQGNPTAEVPSSSIKFALKNSAGEVEIDTAKLPDHVYREALLQGLKVLAERNMSKLTKAAYPNDAERKAAIKAKAEANIQDMYAGKVKLSGQRTEKVAGKVMTEAMRLARALIKDAMRKAKIKQSAVPAKELTAAAKAYIAANPDIVATAEANLKAREASPTIDLSALMKKDVSALPKVTAPKPPLSKTQAGKAKPRAQARPQATSQPSAN